jgi:hypothetical protein
MVPVAPIIAGITFDVTFHMPWIYIMRSLLYFKIYSASFFIILLSPGIATYVNMHVSFLLSRITISSLLLGRVLSVRTCWLRNMITLASWHVSTLVHGYTSVRCLISLLSLCICQSVAEHNTITSLWVLFFIQYCACWYEVFHSLIKLFTDSALLPVSVCNIFVPW